MITLYNKRWILCLLCIFGICDIAKSEDPKGISISIATKIEGDSSIFELTFMNHTEETLYLPSPFTQVGREVISFVFIDESKAEIRVIQKVEPSTGMVSRLKLPPQKKVKEEINLRNGKWVVISSYSDGAATKLFVEVNVPISRQFSKGTWFGKVESNELRIKQSLRQILPHSF